MLIPKEEIKKRFWRKVNKTETCWIWQGANNLFFIRKIINGTRINYCKKIQNLSWEFVNNIKLRQGQALDILCGNELCVNPEHLELRKTKLQNFWDYVEKQENGCWIWKGAYNRRYNCPKITFKSKRVSIRNFSWEVQTNEKLPPYTQLVVTCGNKMCINKKHLKKEIFGCKSTEIGKEYKGNIEDSTQFQDVLRNTA